MVVTNCGKDYALPDRASHTLCKRLSAEEETGLSVIPAAPSFALNKVCDENPGCFIPEALYDSSFAPYMIGARLTLDMAFSCGLQYAFPFSDCAPRSYVFTR